MPLAECVPAVPYLVRANLGLYNIVPVQRPPSVIQKVAKRFVVNLNVGNTKQEGTLSVLERQLSCNVTVEAPVQCSTHGRDSVEDSVDSTWNDTKLGGRTRLDVSDMCLRAGDSP